MEMERAYSTVPVQPSYLHLDIHRRITFSLRFPTILSRVHAASAYLPVSYSTVQYSIAVSCAHTVVD